MTRALSASLALLVAGALTLAAQDQPPRFRGGTNLVRLDVYASAKGQNVADLTKDDFEVYEDNAAQEVSQFEVVRARPATPGATRREPESPQEADRAAGQPGTRAFVFFLDPMNVQVAGSYKAGNPVGEMLDRVIGEDDLVGVMTTEMSARNLTFTRRVQRIAQMLKDNWVWGSRDRSTRRTARGGDSPLLPGQRYTAGWAKAVIERRRERKTLDAISGPGHPPRGRAPGSHVRAAADRGLGAAAARRGAGAAVPAPGSGRTRVPGRPTAVGTAPDGRVGTGGESARRRL